MKHINGITETQLQCKAKVVSAKYGEKTTTIGHLVKGEVIQFDYPYVPPGSIIAFSVKLGMYSNIKYAKTTSDLKIIINVELGRHFLVLKFDKSFFQNAPKAFKQPAEYSQPLCGVKIAFVRFLEISKGFTVDITVDMVLSIGFYGTLSQ